MLNHVYNRIPCISKIILRLIFTIHNFYYTDFETYKI